MAGLNAAAFYEEPASYSHPGITVTLGSSGYSAREDDDTAVFQKAIDTVSEKGGGHVVVPAGDYRIMEVNMRSHVHVFFEPGAMLHPYMKDLIAGARKRYGDNPKTPTQIAMTGNLFNFGRQGQITDVSLVGAKDGTVVDFSTYTSGLRMALLGDVDNFHLTNFYIKDNFTVYSGIILTWGGLENGTARMPCNGLIENIEGYDAHYGYGTIQAHSGTNIQFRNIKCMGGVAVRLETGYSKMNEAGIGGLFNLEVENVYSKYGQGGVFFQPHTMKHGHVTVKNVESYGSEFAVAIGNPFVSKKKFGKNSTRTPGCFKSITIDGVHAVYTDGPIATRSAHLNYYPEELHSLIFKDPNARDRIACYKGPSIAPVANMWTGQNSVITITNVTSEGFKYHPDIITKKDLYKGTVPVRGL